MGLLSQFLTVWTRHSFTATEYSQSPVPYLGGIFKTLLLREILHSFAFTYFSRILYFKVAEKRETRMAIVATMLERLQYQLFLFTDFSHQ